MRCLQRMYQNEFAAFKQTYLLYIPVAGINILDPAIARKHSCLATTLAFFNLDLLGIRVTSLRELRLCILFGFVCGCGSRKLDRLTRIAVGSVSVSCNPLLITNPLCSNLATVAHGFIPTVKREFFVALGVVAYWGA